LGGTTDGQADENPPSYVWQKTINKAAFYTLHIDSKYGRLLSSRKVDFQPLDVYYFYSQPLSG
jgi:hypothetical protein